MIRNLGSDSGDRVTGGSIREGTCAGRPLRRGLMGRDDPLTGTPSPDQGQSLLPVLAPKAQSVARLTPRLTAKSFGNGSAAPIPLAENVS